MDDNSSDETFKRMLEGFKAAGMITDKPYEPEPKATKQNLPDNYYFFIDWVEKDMSGSRWIIQFMTSDQADIVNDMHDTPLYDDLEKIFKKYYGADIDDYGLWDIGAAENCHNAYVAGDESDAIQRTGEIIYILRAEGFLDASIGETHKYKEQVKAILPPQDNNKPSPN